MVPVCHVNDILKATDCIEIVQNVFKKACNFTDFRKYTGSSLIVKPNM